MTLAAHDINEQTRRGIARVAGHVNSPRDLRVGVELKFPVVTPEGAAGSREQVQQLFEHLVDAGWAAVTEGDALIGAATPGEMNDTVASCETGYCKAEFSMAHAADLHAMRKQVDQLQALLQPFADEANVRLIGCGIHPVTPPSAALKMNRSRAGVWGQIYQSNQCIPKDDGDDVDLFTINTANHVHVGVPAEQAAPFVNALNGYAPAQIALGANAKVWRGAVDENHTSVAEAFWDWWQPVAGRVGMPPAPAADLDDYLDTVAQLPCLYVKREDGPVALLGRVQLAEFMAGDGAEGVDLAGNRVTVTPREEDIALHNSCYWFNARLSRYFTVENRIFDQQPADALLAPAAMTLGLAAAAEEACEALGAYDWDALRAARVEAYRYSFGGSGKVDLRGLAAEALELAETGLERRGLDESQYLAPFKRRLESGASPAEEAAQIFTDHGAAGLVQARRWV